MTEPAPLPTVVSRVPPAWLVRVLALLCALMFIALLSVLLSAGDPVAVLLLDHHALPPPNSPFVYPFTIQNLMHLLLFAGFGELFLRWRALRDESALLAGHLLPEDPRVVLQSHDLPAIRARVAGRHDGEQGVLPGLIDLCILQFQSSRSVDQVVSVLNSSLELIAHRVDLCYAMLRYLVWVIPTIGFTGTVIGIALALNLIDPSAGTQPLGEIAQALGVAFYTTLVALIESAILVLLLNLVQTREERVLNQAGHYTLVNLVNRLYAGH
ncbi:MotA/TolQ/ExbB proton channel family protein [Thiorhodovibrio frisius]|uniref:MotA/TolQ/ExbB proton channel family protein n=1 Tax=Thiorhodovibrio frisius TaxID=631362 RepID=UPI002B25A56C|nr:MotA/TolQ/ExbB proton channel family protein [Thiorhodovibrio frisius]WPL23739.1 MotA/TolQ/ExbB proton channel family protein [Thiorhodovibrio frisius]